MNAEGFYASLYTKLELAFSPDSLSKIRKLRLLLQFRGENTEEAILSLISRPRYDRYISAPQPRVVKPAVWSRIFDGLSKLELVLKCPTVNGQRSWDKPIETRLNNYLAWLGPALKLFREHGNHRMKFVLSDLDRNETRSIVKEQLRGRYRVVRGEELDVEDRVVNISKT